MMAVANSSKVETTYGTFIYTDKRTNVYAASRKALGVLKALSLPEHLDLLRDFLVIFGGL